MRQTAANARLGNSLTGIRGSCAVRAAKHHGKAQQDMPLSFQQQKPLIVLIKTHSEKSINHLHTLPRRKHYVILDPHASFVSICMSLAQV
jgi:hypothetical protein